MQRVYPVSNGGIEYIPVAKGTEFIWKGKLGFLTSDSDDIKKAAYLEQIRFTKFLVTYYSLLEFSVPVDQLFALLPAVGGTLGLEGFNAARNGGLGHVWWSVLPDARRMAEDIAFNLGLTDSGAGNVGTAGFDPKARSVVPSVTFELMSELGVWPSPQTFQALFNAQVVVPAKATVTGANIRRAAAPTEYLIVGGTLARDGSAAQLDAGYRVVSATPGAPSDPNGTHCLRFSAGASTDYCFTPLFGDFNDPALTGGFAVKAPYPAGTTRVALIRHDPTNGDTELTALTASGNAPSLTILSPQNRDSWEGKRTIQWSGSDPDGNPLVYAVQYSADNGASWTPVMLDLRDTQFDVDGAQIAGGSQVLFRVLASNGLNTKAATVGPVTVIQRLQLGATVKSVDFGNVTSGAFADRTLAVANSGSGPVNFRAQLADGSAFTVLWPLRAAAVPAGGAATIRLRFAPFTTGPRQDTLAVIGDNPDQTTLTFTLTGAAFNGLVPSIALNPTAFDFVNVNAGQTKDLKFTVSNTGNATLNVRTVSIGNARFTVVSPALPFTVAAGGQQDVTVRFAPNAGDAVSSSLTVNSDDPTHGALMVTLNGSLRSDRCRLPVQCRTEATDPNRSGGHEGTDRALFAFPKR